MVRLTKAQKRRRRQAARIERDVSKSLDEAMELERLGKEVRKLTRKKRFGLF